MTFTVRITTWVNGAPTEARRFEVSSKDEGIKALRSLGHSWDLNPDNRLFAPSAGYLYEDECLVARLNVHQFTYGVYEVDKEGERIPWITSRSATE